MRSSLRPRIALRTRLVAIFALVFIVSTAAVLAVSYLLLADHMRSTLPDGAAEPVLGALAWRYVLAAAGATLLAVALAWIAAHRLLAPIGKITDAARRASDERLDERLRLGGPDDELRELGDTFDAMLDRFQASIETQRRFIANASHELRSPLTALRTEAEVTLADPGAGVAELRRMGERVVQDAEELDELLAALMVLARSQRGLLRTQPLELGALAQGVAADAAIPAERAGVTVATAIATAPVSGDPALLRRLIANLVDNAIRYNRRGGVVDLAVTSDGGRAAVHVSNTGPVIAPDDVERLREPFERLARHGTGSGLGLSIVQAVAEAHDGEVSLRAPATGGLQVSVLLPLRAAAPTEPRRGALTRT